tara:strand:+ start:272 stop:550 length:279 start_codon:yes stop_codon:yes gene_type:complete
MRSEFYEIVSTSETDFQPIDLSGAREVVMILDKAGAVDLGFITNEPFANSLRFPIYQSQEAQPLVVHSTDDRLYFVSSQEGECKLYVWVIRQ